MEKIAFTRRFLNGDMNSLNLRRMIHSSNSKMPCNESYERKSYFDVINNNRSNLRRIEFKKIKEKIKFKEKEKFKDKIKKAQFKKSNKFNLNMFNDEE